MVLLSGVASTTGGGGVASVGGVMEEDGSGVGAVVAKGGVGAGAGVGAGTGAGAGAGAVSEAAPAAGSGSAGGVTVSTTASAAGSFSGGGVGSEGGGGALGSSEESDEAARRLLKDKAGAEAAELDWGTEKASLETDSGGLKRLPEAAPSDKSDLVESSADFWRTAAKLNCAGPLPTSPDSPKANEPAGLTEASLASSPCPTRSPEKLPRVSPAAVFCGSTLKAVEVDVGLSPDVLKGGVGDAVPRAVEKESSAVWPKIILPFPKENLFRSLTCEIPVPCATEVKLSPVEAEVKEKPLLVFCSTEPTGAAETSALDD